MGEFLPAAGLCPDPNGEVIRVDSSDPTRLEESCQRQLGDGCPSLSSSGLRALSSVRYVDEQGGRAVVDVLRLRFSSPEAAFSVFTERALGVLSPDLEPTRGEPEPKTLPGWPHSLLLGTVAHVLWGVDVIELRYADPSARELAERARSEHVLAAVASALRGSLPAKAESPTVVRLLPEEHRLPWGVRVSYRDAFGIDGAGPAALGYYTDAGRSYRIIVASYRDEVSAKDVALGLRRRPGRRDLEEVPFDAFEWSGAMGWDARARHWLVGRFQNRVAAVGSPPEPPESARRGRLRDWLTRQEKLQLLRKTFSRR